MAEALDARELGAALPAADAEFFPLDDLPNDVLVSVFEAVEDPTWVRHTVPLVCKAWNELYRSRDASPLHETLEVDFYKEVDRVAAAAAARARGARHRDPAAGAPRPPVVHASRVISWAQERAGSVRKLHLKPGWDENRLKDFSAEDSGALVAVVGSSLTGISVGPFLGELCKRPFWESLRTSVVPAGRLRSLKIEGIAAGTFGADLEPLLGQLAGSLEELGLKCIGEGLSRFPESLFALEKLRLLELSGNPQITAIPAGISSLKELEELKLSRCELSSLPRELGELSGLTRLELCRNWDLGNALPAAVDEEDDDEEDDDEDLRTRPESEVFPAELGKMKSLRELNLRGCGLRTVPAFVCKLESLEILTLECNHLSSLPKELGELSGLTKLDLSYNQNLGTALLANEAFPAELGGMESLRELSLSWCGLRAVPAFVGELESLQVLHLFGNEDLQIDAPLDFLIEGCPRLRVVQVGKVSCRSRRLTRELRAHLEAFAAKLRARNPDAYVEY